MGFKRQDALIESRLQDRVDNSNDFILLNWLCRRTNDNASPDEPHRCTLHKILDETPIKMIKTIRRRLKAMDKTGIIHYSESPLRYGYKCEIRIIDPAYIDALSRIQGRQVADTLVTGHDDHSQQAIDTLVTGHGNHSQKHQSTNAEPQIAGSGHRDHSNGYGDHSHSKKKEVKDLDGWMEDIDPSIQGLRAEEVNLNRRMLTHPDVGISQAKADEIAVDYDARTVFAQCCRYINDHQQSDVRGPGALINRFDNPDRWPTPEIAETDGSSFYYEHHQTVRNIDEQPQPDANEISATNEPATAHGDALSAFNPTDKAQINPDPDNQPVQTPSETPDEQRPKVNGSNSSVDRWRQVKHELQLQLPETTFETWVRDTEPIDYTAGAFIVGAPHRPARDWLTARLLQKTKTVLERLTGQQVNLLFVDRSDPQDRPALAKRTVAAMGGSDDDTGEAAAVRPQPVPRLKERLRQLLADKPVQENDRIVRELQGRINALKAEQLTTAETQDRIDQLIADRIAVLEAEEEPPQDTAGIAYADAAAVGGSDDGQVDAAPDTTDTLGPPAAEQKAPDEPDYLRQAQDAERELKQARIKHSQRRRRDHRRRQSVSTWVPEYSSHRQNGTASQPVRPP